MLKCLPMLLLILYGNLRFQGSIDIDDILGKIINWFIGSLGLLAMSNGETALAIQHFAEERQFRQAWHLSLRIEGTIHITEILED